jgi:hypothetical protein
LLPLFLLALLIARVARGHHLGPKNCSAQPLKCLLLRLAMQSLFLQQHPCRVNLQQSIVQVS